MFNNTQLKSYALNFNKHHYLPVLYYFTPIIERTHLKELKKHNIKSTILAPGSSLYTWCIITNSWIKNPLNKQHWRYILCDIWYPFSLYYTHYSISMFFYKNYLKTDLIKLEKSKKYKSYSYSLDDLKESKEDPFLLCISDVTSYINDNEFEELKLDLKDVEEHEDEDIEKDKYKNEDKDASKDESLNKDKLKKLKGGMNGPFFSAPIFFNKMYKSPLYSYPILDIRLSYMHSISFFSYIIPFKSKQLLLYLNTLATQLYYFIYYIYLYTYYLLYIKVFRNTIYKYSTKHIIKFNDILNKL